jgi:hypothetical protein
MNRLKQTTTSTLPQLNGTKRWSIYYHSPCFDGIVSALIMVTVLAKSGSTYRLRPVGYDRRKQWLSSKLFTPAIVVDFPYHPDATFWADHHDTTFLSTEHKAHFDRRKDHESLLFRPHMEACADLLWHRFGALLGRPRALEFLVRRASAIDAAKYPTVNEAVLPRDPANQVNASLSLRDADRFGAKMVEALRTTPLSSLIKRPDVHHRIAMTATLTKLGLQRVTRAAQMSEDGIAQFSVSERGVVINRYSAFYIYPEAQFSLATVRGHRGHKITLMRNPWIEFAHPHLGLLASRFGGGGHSRIGSILLSRDHSIDSAQNLAARLLSQLRAESAQQNPHQAALM